MQECPGSIYIHWQWDGHRLNSNHPRWQRRPLQGSAGEPRQFPNDDGVGRTGRCSAATADFNFHTLNRVNDENDSNRKDRQTAEIL